MQASLLPIGLGAGAVSALLAATAFSGSSFSLFLLPLTPLPILLAGLGWRHHAGLVAAISTSVAVALLSGNHAGLGFAVTIGLPAWWLAYLALLARSDKEGSPTEWYPVGRLVVWCAVIGAAAVAVAIPLIGSSLEEVRETLRDFFVKGWQEAAQAGRPMPLPRGQDLKPIADIMALVLPIFAATMLTQLWILNLWLAGRIVRASGRLVRPWPDIANMELPRAATLALLGGFAGSFLPGLPGFVAELVSATFLIAFILLGLAVLHVTTRATSARGFILVALYALLVLMPWVAVFVAALGLTEQLFGIRRRFGSPPGDPPPAAANLP